MVTYRWHNRRPAALDSAYEWPAVIGEVSQSLEDCLDAIERGDEPVAAVLAAIGRGQALVEAALPGLRDPHQWVHVEAVAHTYACTLLRLCEALHGGEDVELELDWYCGGLITCRPIDAWASGVLKPITISPNVERVDSVKGTWCVGEGRHRIKNPDIGMIEIAERYRVTRQAIHFQLGKLFQRLRLSLA